MHAGTTAKAAHRIAKLRIDERVDDDRGVAASAQDCALEIRHGLGPGVTYLLELLFRELRLQRLHEPRSSFPGGVGDDVQFHALRHRAEASGWRPQGAGTRL